MDEKNKTNIGTIDLETWEYYYREMLTEDSMDFQIPMNIGIDNGSQTAKAKQSIWT